MAQPDVSFEYLIALVDRLNPVQRKALIDHLNETQLPLSLDESRRKTLLQTASERDLTFSEWKTLFDLAVIHAPADFDFSNRREDWYGDDGR
ncbi:MAG: hypothetical protein U0670_24585 [Anaerolineae bacterium]